MKCVLCLGRGCSICHETGKQLVGGFVESNERYTPVHILDSVREVYGGTIDFDPASTKRANDRGVHATTFYDYKANGLNQQWRGKGWCNPPYGRVKDSVTGLQSLFIEKGLDHYYRGEVEAIMFLLNGNAIHRSWYYPLKEFPFCSYLGDIKFYSPTNGEFYKTGFGSIIVYVGDNTRKFYDVFRKHGMILGERRW